MSKYFFQNNFTCVIVLIAGCGSYILDNCIFVHFWSRKSFFNKSPVLSFSVLLHKNDLAGNPDPQIKGGTLPSIPIGTSPPLLYIFPDETLK